MTDLRSWLAGRTPPPPDALPLAAAGGGEIGEALLEAGVTALERALAGGGERGGAFDLLAADAWLTYACEHAASAAKPEPVLLHIVERLGRRAG